MQSSYSSDSRRIHRVYQILLPKYNYFFLLCVNRLQPHTKNEWNSSKTSQIQDLSDGWSLLPQSLIHPLTFSPLLSSVFGLSSTCLSAWRRRKPRQMVQSRCILQNHKLLRLRLRGSYRCLPIPPKADLCNRCRLVHG